MDSTIGSDMVSTRYRIPFSFINVCPITFFLPFPDIVYKKCHTASGSVIRNCVAKMDMVQKNPLPAGFMNLL